MLCWPSVPCDHFSDFGFDDGWGPFDDGAGVLHLLLCKRTHYAPPRSTSLTDGYGNYTNYLEFFWTVDLSLHLLFITVYTRKYLLWAFFMVLGVGLKASYLLGKHSTAWAMPLAPFCSGYFLDRVSFFCLGQPRPWPSYCILLTIAGMTGACWCLGTRRSATMDSCSLLL
jgi:hypothetical protein